MEGTRKRLGLQREPRRHFQCGARDARAVRVGIGVGVGIGIGVGLVAPHSRYAFCLGVRLSSIVVSGSV